MEADFILRQIGACRIEPQMTFSDHYVTRCLISFYPRICAKNFVETRIVDMKIKTRCALAVNTKCQMCMSQLGIRAILAQDVSLLWDFKPDMLEWLLLVTFFFWSDCWAATFSLLLQIPSRESTSATHIDSAHSILGASSLAALRTR